MHNKETATWRSTAATSTRPESSFLDSAHLPAINCVINELNEHFSDEQRHAQGLLCLVPSVWLSTTMKPLDCIEMAR